MAAQLLMLYLEMIEKNKTITINSSNIDDFYLKNLDFDIYSDKAKDFESILDMLYNILDPEIRLDNYEAIHLLLFLKKIKDLGLKNYEENFLQAFLKFRENLNDAKKAEIGKYWTEFGIRTGTNATNANTILKRHKFFVDEMINSMYDGYTLVSCELGNVFDKNILVGNTNYKDLAEAIRILIPLKSKYIPKMAIDYFNIGDNKEISKEVQSFNDIQTRPNQTTRQKNEVAEVGISTLIDFVNECIKEDERFIRIFEKRTIKTKKRKLVSINKNELFTKRPDLVDKYSKQLNNNWWIGTNNSNNQNTDFYKIASDIIEELKINRK